MKRTIDIYKKFDENNPKDFYLTSDVLKNGGCSIETIKASYEIVDKYAVFSITRKLADPPFDEHKTVKVIECQTKEDEILLLPDATLEVLKEAIKENYYKGDELEFKTKRD